MKKYTTNTEVILKHTGDRGVIVELLPDQMVMVELEDGDEIPVFMDEIIHADEAFLLKETQKVEQKKQPKKSVNKTILSPSQITTLLENSLGIQLAFDVQNNLEGIPMEYRIHLINDTKYNALFSFQLSTNKIRGKEQHGKIDSCTSQCLQTISHDTLNDNITITVSCWQLTTLGTGNKLTTELKIKPKHFFKKQRVAPILNKNTYHYILFSDFEKHPTTKTEDLKSYTQRKSQELPRKKKPKQSFYSKNDVNTFASFRNEIDLHIEKIAPNHGRLSNQEIINIQLDAFDKFFSKALELGVSPIFVIHGVGKGRLKNKIAERLRSSFYVKKYKNEYHPKYGYGATEIHL